MKEALTKLITVKTLITLVCLGVFVYAVVTGIVDGEFVKTILMMVFAFYFGTQYQKNADAIKDMSKEDDYERQDV